MLMEKSYINIKEQKIFKNCGKYVIFNQKVLNLHFGSLKSKVILRITLSKSNLTYLGLILNARKF